MSGAGCRLSLRSNDTQGREGAKAFSLVVASLMSVAGMFSGWFRRIPNAFHITTGNLFYGFLEQVTVSVACFQFLCWPGRNCPLLPCWQSWGWWGDGGVGFSNLLGPMLWRRHGPAFRAGGVSVLQVHVPTVLFSSHQGLAWCLEHMPFVEIELMVAVVACQRASCQYRFYHG